MNPLDLLNYSCSCSMSSCDGDLHNLIMFFFRKPLCLFVRTSLVVLELKDSYSNIIVMRTPYISLGIYQILLQLPLLQADELWSIPSSYMELFQNLSIFFLLFFLASVMNLKGLCFFEIQWSEIQC